VPKQFCSLRGGHTLLHEALERAAAVVPPPRICTVVAAQHRRWWQAPLRHLPAENVIVQPENRGTAHGILLPLLHIAVRDPEAVVVLLPADHHLRDEAPLADSLRRATTHAAAERHAVFMLGVVPEAPDTELGYIVPAGSPNGVPAEVLQFIEKPAREPARALVERGALWNVFIIAATARALLALYETRQARTVAAMRAVVGCDGAEERRAAAADLYRVLPTVDFSRDLITGQETALRVVAVPQCGWTDLGTPRRVAETLRRLPRDLRPGNPMPAEAQYLNLAVQNRRLQAGGNAQIAHGASQ
jgi:mannose-1-phosphate guanylyltransferase